MVVAAVDQRDFDRRARKTEGGFQSAEAGADDHHALPGDAALRRRADAGDRQPETADGAQQRPNGRVIDHSEVNVGDMNDGTRGAALLSVLTGSGRRGI